MKNGAWHLLGWSGMALCWASCTGIVAIPAGSVGEGDTSNLDENAATALACKDRTLPGQPLRRLSSTQYANTLRDLFGKELAAPLLKGSVFPATLIKTGFINDAEANLVNTSESNAIEENAAKIAKLLLDDPEPYLTALMPCKVDMANADSAIDGCIDDFISKFGARAYRRPLTKGEAKVISDLYAGLRKDQTAVEAWSGVMQLFVQAPALLYRVERGAGEAAPGLIKLSDHEMASRLSYFFLDSMPDDTLFAEAEAGRLSTKEQVEAQARRLVDSSRFAKVLESFHRDWLRLYTLDEAGKDTALFPEFTAEVQASMRSEPARLVSYVLDEADGSIATLLGTSTIPVNASLAEFYGVKAPGADADTWVPVEIKDRRGLFTLASFMAAEAMPDRTNPIRRGAFFQREILCNDLPSLPGNVDTAGPLQDTSMLPTARERLAPLMTNGSCAGCHTRFNPTGLALENYDAVGRWRDKENGSAIDSSGHINLDGKDHAFESPLELASLVAESEQAKDCYTKQWYRAALGRREFTEDTCSLETVRQKVKSSGGDLRELFVALTQTDAFLYRKLEDGTDP